MERVVANAAIDYLRRQSYRTREEPLEESKSEDLSYEDPFPASTADFDFAEDKQTEAFSKLTTLRRQILTLSFYEGRTACEVSVELDCPIEDVYKHKHRALKALRDQLIEENRSHED